MKKSILFSIFLFISLTIFSCFPYNQIIKESDNYKHENKIYIVLLQTAKPNKTNFGFVNTRKNIKLKFEKIYNSNTDSLKFMKLYIEGTIEPNEFIENPLFIKTVQNIHEINYNIIDNINFEKNVESKTDSTKITTATKSEIEKIIRSSLIIPSTIIKEIKESPILNLRIYINEHPYDIEIKYAKLKKLKQFINESPNS